MGTATGLTAARMLEIEASSVVDGDVVGDNLVLATRGGVQIPAGNVRGPQGVQGVQGSQGNQGNQGLTGSGAQGVQGSPGGQGSQGFQGPQGLQGQRGQQGFQGNQGNQGNQGTQGFQGLTGSQGVQGATGSQGSQGNQGLQGATGSQGAQGNQGRIGGVAYTYDSSTTIADPGSGKLRVAVGITSIAISETDGASTTVDNWLALLQPGSYLLVQNNRTGTSFAFATTSITDNGTWWTLNGSAVTSIPAGWANNDSVSLHISVKGPQGFQGSLGNQGVQGATGSQGSQGNQGFQGTQGVRGFQGFQGFQGVQGAVGSQGPQGTQGLQGSQGTQGRNGGVAYTYDSTTTIADPGSGKLRFNTALTSIAISETDGGTTTVDTWLALLVPGSHVLIQNNRTGTSLAFQVSSTVDNGAWWTINGAMVTSVPAGWTNNDSLSINLSVRGAQGIQGTQGTSGVNASVLVAASSDTAANTALLVANGWTAESANSLVGTFTAPVSGQAKVTISATLVTNTTNLRLDFGVKWALGGSFVRNPLDREILMIYGASASGLSASKTFIVTGMVAGASYTVTSMLRAQVANGTVGVVDRSVIVEAM